jgi:hypothetical protein
MPRGLSLVFHWALPYTRHRQQQEAIMEVRKDFAKRVSAIAKATPREAVGNLLKGLLPKEPVRTRAPSPPAWAKAIGEGMYAGRPEKPPFGAVRDPLAPLRKVRRRAPRSARYVAIELLVRPERSGLKRGSGRYAKLEWLWDHNVTNASECLGMDAVDSNGKLHTIDMGALRGMAERGHIKMGE